jgi:hypothetical protein
MFDDHFPMGPAASRLWSKWKCLSAQGASDAVMSASGPSRHFAATQQFGRFRSEADMGR